MELDNESWLIEYGDEVIEKKASKGFDALNDIEAAVYCLWVIDYAVRNSGTLEPISDLFPEAMVMLAELSQRNGWEKNALVAKESRNQEEFCSQYYDKFENLCSELRAAYEST